VLAPAFRARSVRQGVLVCEGADWPARLRWPYRAVTFGHVVLSTTPLDEATFAHELVHVSQWERWGPLMFVVYPLASLTAWMSGGHFYRDNRFEAEARRRAGA
jgi:hypothetical protein